MNKYAILAWWTLVLLAAGAVAQSTVTTSSPTSSGAVPVFNGTATVTNSPISVAGSNVGIGTTTPQATLDVRGPILNVTNQNGTFPTINSGVSASGGTSIGWNAFGSGLGETDFINVFRDSANTASGGFAFFDMSSPTTVNAAPLLYVAPAGGVGIGTTSPTAGLDIEQSSNPDTGGITVGLKVNNTITGGSTTDYPQNYLQTLYSGSGTQSYLYGQATEVIQQGPGSLTNGYSSLFRVVNNSSTGGSITNGYGVFVDTPQGGGTIMNAYGLYIRPQTVSGVSTGYSIFQAGPSDINSFAGSVGIGTTSPGAKLEIDGNLKLTSGSGASVTYADGTQQTTAWTGVLCGGDYAESVDVTGDRSHYEPGDVLVIDPNSPGKFLKSAEPYSTSVTGIYSTKPGAVGRRLTGIKSPDEVPMAMIGIVPTKVSAENGPVHPGDLLVTSSTIGYAMKGTDRSLLTGAVIGKALGNLDSGKGEIEVVVTLQ